MFPFLCADAERLRGKIVSGLGTGADTLREVPGALPTPVRTT